jgi:hypothetical protein
MLFQVKVTDILLNLLPIRALKSIESLFSPGQADASLWILQQL